ncbi:MAG: LL-diaminopimelate aminotransferase [Bacteroidetes bacterium ADurb.BinA245]|nr:MAG: LL-diaminopimelate aminotransferase [Bacteroidetes bacterium ADurb.BinA245]
MKTSNRLNGIGEYYFSQKLRDIEALNKAGKSVINLGIGSPDLPPHSSVITTLQEVASKPDTHTYQSYKGAAVLRNAIGNWYQKWYGVSLDPQTEILPLMGSKEGILHICMTYLNEGDEVLVPNPGYPTYTSAVKLSGGSCIEYELLEANNYFSDFEKLETLDLNKIKLWFVNYPHMPTGQSASIAQVEKMIAFAQKNKILIVHDNPYSFILNDEPLSLLSIAGAKDCVVELNSLSKSHNMAGWRVGMLCGAKERIEEVLRFKSNMDSGMFLPVQLAAARALELGEEWHASVNTVYSKRREKVYEILNLLNCSYSKNQSGLFVWAAVPDSKVEAKHQFGMGGVLSDRLLNESGIFVTPGGIFGTAGNGFVRISLCAAEEKLDEVINRIKQKIKN